MLEETTVTARGVDQKIWIEFQKAIIDRYGNLYGYVGLELTKAIRLWLKQKDSKGAGREQQLRNRTVGQMIREAVTDHGGEASIQEVASYIHEKYGPVKMSSISTDMSDFSVNGPESSSYPTDKRFLERVSRGRYRLLPKGR